MKNGGSRSTGRQHRLEESSLERRTEWSRQNESLDQLAEADSLVGRRSGGRQASISSLQPVRGTTRSRNPDGVCARQPQDRPYLDSRIASPLQSGETRNVRTTSDLKRKEQEGKANEASLLQVNLDNQVRLLPRTTPSPSPTDEFAGIKGRHRQLHPPADLSSRTRPSKGRSQSRSPPAGGPQPLARPASERLPSPSAGHHKKREAGCNLETRPS